MQDDNKSSIEILFLTDRKLMLKMRAKNAYLIIFKITETVENKSSNRKVRNFHRLIDTQKLLWNDGFGFFKSQTFPNWLRTRKKQYNQGRIEDFLEGGRISKKKSKFCRPFFSRSSLLILGSVISK